MTSANTCAIPACEKPRKGRNRLCSMHTARVARHGDVEYVTPPRRRDPVERFWEKVDRRSDDECWPWQGTVLSTGYGQFNVDGRKVMAHRYSYELNVNPAHLEPVTPHENWRRSSGPATLNVAKTTCPAGHEYDKTVKPANRNAYRICTTCAKESLRRSRANKAAAR